MEKKGLSAVVGTILLILLVIVAVGIIWAVASGLFKGGAEELSTGFLIDMDIKSATLSGTDVTVSVKRNVGAGTLSGIKFVFSDGESTKSAEKSTSMDELDQESFSFDIAALGIPDAYEVSIAPIYKSEAGEDILRNIVDRAEFREADESGGNGNGCVPDCAGKECGDDGCGGSCGDCVTLYGEGYICSNFVCVEEVACEDTCLSLGYECETWEICGVQVDCSLEIGCTASEICNTETGKCESNLLLSGTVDSVWPGDAPRYFDSDELPTDGTELDLVLRYINFSNPTETGCIKIIGAEYVYNEGPPVYNKTHLELERVVEIVALDDYQIWKSETCAA